MQKQDADVKPVDEEAFDFVQKKIDELLEKHADEPVIDGNTYTLEGDAADNPLR